MKNKLLNERDLEKAVGGTDDYGRKDHYENIILGRPLNGNTPEKAQVTVGLHDMPEIQRDERYVMKALPDTPD